MHRRPGSTTLAQAARDAIRAGAATPDHCGMQTADLPLPDADALAHSARVRARRPRRDRRDRRLDPVRRATWSSRSRAGARLLRRRRGQARRRRRLRHRAGDDAAVRRRAGDAGRRRSSRASSGREIVELGAGSGRLARRPPAGAGRARRAAVALRDPRSRAPTSPHGSARRSHARSRRQSRARRVAVDAAARRSTGAILANEVLDAVPVAPRRARAAAGGSSAASTWDERAGHASRGPTGRRRRALRGAGRGALPGRRRLPERDQSGRRGAGRGRRPAARRRRRAPHRLRLSAPPSTTTRSATRAR